MNVVYRKKEYKVYSVGNGFIIHNTKYDFETHHTHINNYKTCIYIINLCIHKSIPYRLSTYLLTSITRITGDKVYKNNIQEIINSKNRNNNYYKRKG